MVDLFVDKKAGRQKKQACGPEAGMRTRGWQADQRLAGGPEAGMQTQGNGQAAR